MVLAGIGHHVQGRHDQTRAVADDAHGTVELDVVQVVLLGLELERIGGVAVLELDVAGLPEVGVLVQRDLAVQRQDLIVGRADQRVHLDERGVLADEDLPELLDGHRGGVEHLGRQMALLGDRPGGGQVDTLDSVHGHLGEALRLGCGHLFDLHAALDGAHRQVGPIRPIQQEGDVVLLGDVTGLGDQQLLDDVALDVQAQDVLGVGVGVLGGRGELDAAGLTATACLDLRLHHDRPADLLGDGLGVLGGVGDPPGRGRNIVLGEQFLRLVLEKVHRLPNWRSHIAYR